jgi:hypothetical protein
MGKDRVGEVTRDTFARLGVMMPPISCWGEAILVFVVDLEVSNQVRLWRFLSFAFTARAMKCRPHNISLTVAVSM